MTGAVEPHNGGSHESNDWAWADPRAGVTYTMGEER